mgnify:FL=1
MKQTITTNFSMMTMATQTSRARKMLNLLKRLSKQDYLYTEEKLKDIKSQIKVLEHEISEMEKKTFKGFGK